MTIEVWCDNCDTWIDDVEISALSPEWICCSACGNGVVRDRPDEIKTYTIDKVIRMPKETRIKIAKSMWGL